MVENFEQQDRPASVESNENIKELVAKVDFLRELRREQEDKQRAELEA